MKYIKTLALILAVGGMMVSCKDDDVKNPGNPVMEITGGNVGSTFFGDTLRLEIKATDNQVPLSTIHADLYFDSEKVASQVVRTKVSGDTYPVALYVPYIAEIPDGQATLRLTLQNINFTTTEQTYGVDVSHADYPYLTFVAEDGTQYQMDRVSMYNYEMTGSYPGDMPGKIVAPALAGPTEEVTFGYENGVIAVNGSKNIPFTNGGAGTYTISFNTFSFEGSPFINMSLNGYSFEVSPEHDTMYLVDVPNLAKGDALTFEGIPGMEEWWLNPDFMNKNADGSISFMAYNGDYRFIADTKNKYFQVIKLNSGIPATLSEDGSGLAWIIGEGIGYPSLSNAPGWEPSQAIPMAPQGDNIYQATVVGGVNIGVNSINFKFFGQQNWSPIELKGNMLTSESDLIGVGQGSDGHDDGNLYLLDGVQLETNVIYVITLDLTGGVNNAILKLSIAGQNEFEAKPVYMNGKELDTADNSTYSLVASMNQNEAVSFTGDIDMSKLYVDPDYFKAEGGDLFFLPVDGYYNIVVNKERGYISASTRNQDGTAMALQPDGTGAIWIIGEGVGNPSLEYQVGWTPENAICMPEVMPKIYQFTAQAGENLSDVPGQRIQANSVNFKFFYINKWDNGEFGSNNLLTETGTASDYITVGQSDGNIHLASGVELEVGATYRITIDLTNGVEDGTIDFEKL